MHLSPAPTPSNIRVFITCLLSFAILIMPFAALAAPRSAGSATVKERSVSTATETSNNASAAREAFVNPPPVAPSISASMTAALVPTGNNGDGKADPNDTIIYTATITNSGLDATGVNFADTVDPHTTFVGGSLDISPLALDDTYATIGNTLLEVGPVG